MNLLELTVKILAEDKASDEIESISTGAIAKAQMIGSAAYDALKTIGSAAVDAGQAIVGGAMEGFASYEQLAGGVKKLYSNEMADASDKIMQYAQKAYETAGMSANQYMEQATSFSAALINSLGGDVDKAADQTDKAMRMMSDNVNTFGTDAESVQNAIQGLSRENYTMIDNLKLGYAGTKEGMQKLIDDANAYAASQGQAADLTMGNFSDMIDAIDLIQQKQGIWGTTAKEAATTVEGSVNMVKSAWDNLLVAFGSGDQEQMNAAITGLMDGIFGKVNEETQKREGGLIQNVLPVLENIKNSIMEQLPTIIEELGTTFVTLVGQTFNIPPEQTAGFLDGIKAAIDAVGEAFNTAKGWVDAFVGAFVGDSPNEFLSGIADVMTRLHDAAQPVIDAFSNLMSAVMPALGEIAAHVGEVFATYILPAIEDLSGPLSHLIDAFSTFIEPLKAVLEVLITIAGIVGGVIVEVLGIAIDIVARVIDFLGNLFNAIMNIPNSISEFASSVSKWFSEAGEKIGSFVTDAIKGLGNWAKDMVDKAVETGTNFFNSVKEKFGEVVDWFKNLPQNILNALGDLGSVLLDAGKNIIEGFLNGIKDAFNGVQEFVGGIGNWIADHKGPRLYDLGLLVPNGGWIMQGLEKGMRSKFGLIKDVVGDISEMISGSRFDVMANVSSSKPQQGGNVVNIYLDYSAGEDGTQLVEDMRSQLMLYGMTMGGVTYGNL